MRDERPDKPMVFLRPIFVEAMPPFGEIKDGDIWISHRHRTINLRCPCGCGELTVLSLHPSRWHVYFDGKSISLEGPTGGSIWTSSDCGSHYHIRENKVLWSYRIDPALRTSYEAAEWERMVAQPRSGGALGRMVRRLWRGVSPASPRK